MVEIRSATSRRTRTGDSYVSQWNRFVTWSEASGRRSLPATPEDVAAYLEDRSETGARPSILRVVAAAIARNHRGRRFRRARPSGRRPDRAGRADAGAVLAGEAARRHEWPDIRDRVMAACTNPLYKELWRRWLERVGA